MIKTGGRGLEMPLAHDCGLVAGLLQELGDSLLGSIKGVLVGTLPVQVGMFACQNDRTRRGTDGIRNQTMPKEHALLRNAVQMWGRRNLRQRPAISRQRLERMVIGKQEQDVGPLVLGGVER